MNFRTKLDLAIQTALNGLLTETPADGAIEAMIDMYRDEHGGGDLGTILAGVTGQLQKHYIPQLQRVRARLEALHRRRAADGPRPGGRAHQQVNSRGTPGGRPLQDYIITLTDIVLAPGYDHWSDDGQHAHGLFQNRAWRLQDGAHALAMGDHDDMCDDQSIIQVEEIYHELRQYYHQIADILWDPINRPGPSRPGT